MPAKRLFTTGACRRIAGQAMDRRPSSIGDFVDDCGSDECSPLLGGGLLGQEARGGGHPRDLFGFSIVADGHAEDQRPDIGPVDHARGIDAVHARHTHIHDNHIRRQAVRQFDRFDAVAGFAEDADILVPF